MGRQALLAVLFWLTLSLTLGDKGTRKSAVQDNEGAESAPRLYRNVQLGVYASAAPYGAHSFHLPTFISAPKTSASQVIPVRENFLSHLTDSYGNKFVGTPQLSSYKIAYPQQFVALQTKLPEHLAQPLVAASPNFQFKPSNGQFFGVPFRVPALQGPTPTPLHHFPTFGQLYGDKVQNFAPSSVSHSQAYSIPNTQHQSTNNKAVFTNKEPQQHYNNYKSDSKNSEHKESQIIVGKPKVQSIQELPHETYAENIFQKIQEAPHSSYGEPKFQRIQEASQTHYKDGKSQRIQETPQSHHIHSDSKQQQHLSGDSKERHQHAPELPHYESKYQIIHEHPHSPQFHEIQEQHAPHGQVKSQGLHEAPPAARTHHDIQPSQHGGNTQAHHGNGKLQAAPAKQTVTYINDINGERTIVELETKPSLPLLDLTLLEPLTFDNPLVPQVQHFLPKIHQATYQKLPEAAIKKYQKEYGVQKTTSYNSEDGHEKPQKEAPKKKHKKPTQHNKYPKKNDTPKKTPVTYHETFDDAPEIVYEINSPNYKEVVSQKALSYNRETGSEPVHYSYGSKAEKDPVTYSYSRTSKEPVQVMSVQYHGNNPSHLIYTLKPEEQAHEERTHNSAPHHVESESDEEGSQETGDDTPRHGHHAEQYKEVEEPRSAPEPREPSPKVKQNYHKSEPKSQEIEEDNPPKYYSEPAHITSENINFQPILKEYENNIRLLTEPSASIKVDPSQHVHHPKSTPQPYVHREEHSHQRHNHPHSSPAPQEQPNSAEEPSRSHYGSSPHSEAYNTPAPHILEKSKRIIIQEESPDEMHMLREQMREEVIKREENSEEDFEKGYHDAAIGFPAYNQKSDPEKDIFDPESYGVPPDHVEYDFDHTPLQQYQDASDTFPKETRSRYKDARDKMMQNYYSGFSISKPESLIDRYQNKLGYYKLYKEQKPDYLTDSEEDKKEQKSAKYSAAPSFAFNSPDERSKSYYGNNKPKQQLYEYDYSKGRPRDNTAFASRPYQNYKSRTSFVEPQFQYGFEPIAIPKLLDSELAAMASNDSPESSKPGMRKKIYKENWYIKKTSTSAGSPAS